jgi:hypothetical protein
LIVAGSGWIGKHEVAPLCVHYANAYTGYGPVRAGKDGLSYLVFRLGVDPGAAYLPESRSSMKDVPRRVVISEVLQSECIDEKHGPLRRAEVDAIAAGPDGLCAQLRTISADEAFVLEDDARRGRFIYLAQGSATMQDRELSKGSCIAIGPREGLALRSGRLGAQLLLMTFPGNIGA